MNFLENMALLGVIGLLGLVPFMYPVPKQSAGGHVRLCGALGLIGIVGIWGSPLGACGAFGALGLWNHPNKFLARLSLLGFFGPLGFIAFLWSLFT